MEKNRKNAPTTEKVEYEHVHAAVDNLFTVLKLRIDDNYINDLAVPLYKAGERTIEALRLLPAFSNAELCIPDDYLIMHSCVIHLTSLRGLFPTKVSLNIGAYYANLTGKKDKQLVLTERCIQRNVEIFDGALIDPDHMINTIGNRLLLNGPLSVFIYSKRESIVYSSCSMQTFHTEMPTYKKHPDFNPDNAYLTYARLLASK